MNPSGIHAPVLDVGVFRLCGELFRRHRVSQYGIFLDFVCYEGHLHSERVVVEFWNYAYVGGVVCQDMEGVSSFPQSTLLQTPCRQ